MKKILVTGGSGFLGSRICAYYRAVKKEEYEVVVPSHDEMDITDQTGVERYVKMQNPDLVIHCAAISDTGYAQEHPEESYLINVTGTANLAEITGKMGIRFIFMSSDQIYNGKTIAGSEYDIKKDACAELQDDCPINEYGKQKKEAEEKSLEANPDTVALRLTWMYDIEREGMKNNRNLITNLCQAALEGRSLQFARHEYRGITNVWEVVYNLEKVMKIPAGIYNFGSQNCAPTIEVAEKVVEILGKDGKVEEDSKRFRERPRNLTICNAKAEKEGIYFYNTLEGLQWFGEEFRKNDAHMQ